MPINITIDHATSEHSSQASSLTDGEDSSGTGVQVDSPTSAVGSQEYSDSLEENERWQVLQTADPDDIGPSESASRPRTSNHNRPIVEAPRPELAHRQSARRQVSYEHHRHPLPRTQRQPPLAPPESVDSNEEYAGYARAPQQHHGRIYQHWGHAGSPPANYTSSYSSSQPYSPFPTTSIIPAGQQLTPFVSPSPYAFPPYQSAPSGAAPGYFTTGHHGGASMGNPMAPHGGATYGGQEMMHPGPGAAYYPYSAQAYPMPQAMAPPPIYPPFAVYSPPPPPAAAATPPPPAPPADTSKVDENFARLEKLFLDQKAEQEAKEAAAKKAAEDAAAKAAADKKIAEDIAAAASAAAAAATEEAEKKAAEQKAKEKAEAEAAAEKAAKEAADKKAVEDAAAAAAAAAAPPPPPPPPEEKKKPIKFKDAVGRKFSFPFHLCNTWSGMEDLIRQAFLHVEVIGPHVAEGHYDLVGTNGEIILPQVWGTVIEPDTTITMHMWPMPEPPKPEDPPPESAADVVVVPEAKKEDTGKKKKPPKPKQTTSIGWFAGRPKPKTKAAKGGKKGADAVPPVPPPPPPPPAPSVP